MKPSKSFVNSLKGLDSLLSVGWGSYAQQWTILRKGYVSDAELGYLRSRASRLERLIPNFVGHPNQLEKMKSTLIGIKEDIVAGEEGKRVILFARELSSRVYDALVLSDMQRYGGYARMADLMEEAEEKRERELEEKMQAQRIAFNKEVYDQLNFIWRKKEEKLLSGERDMGYMLHGVLTDPDAPPLIQITDF
jgi:hypothetical protein